jgi:hypothetical protein
MQNAAVFPVPVWAHPIRSRSEKAIGIAFAWMGVGFSKFISFSAFWSRDGNCNSLKWCICTPLKRSTYVSERRDYPSSTEALGWRKKAREFFFFTHD